MNDPPEQLELYGSARGAPYDSATIPPIPTIKSWCSGCLLTYTPHARYWVFGRCQSCRRTDRALRVLFISAAVWLTPFAARVVHVLTGTLLHFIPRAYWTFFQ
jgi:hypothetical protein